MRKSRLISAWFHQFLVVQFLFYLYTKTKLPFTETFPCLFSFSNFSIPEKKKKRFCSLKSSGIFQLQTELIALNHHRSLKVSGHSDVITGVAEVAWESSELLSLTSPSLQRCIHSVSSITPFAWFRQHWDWLGRALWAWDVVFGVLMRCRGCGCVCVCLWIQSKAWLQGSDGRKWAGWLGGIEGWRDGGMRLDSRPQGRWGFRIGAQSLSVSVCLTRLSSLKAPLLTPYCVFPRCLWWHCNTVYFDHENPVQIMWELQLKSVARVFIFLFSLFCTFPNVYIYIHATVPCIYLVIFEYLCIFLIINTDI